MLIKIIKFDNADQVGCYCWLDKLGMAARYRVTTVIRQAGAILFLANYLPMSLIFWVELDNQLVPCSPVWPWLSRTRFVQSSHSHKAGRCLFSCHAFGLLTFKTKIDKSASAILAILRKAVESWWGLSWETLDNIQGFPGPPNYFPNIVLRNLVCCSMITLHAKVQQLSFTSN